MSSDSFNKILTLGLFGFFGVIYILSFITNKPVDWQNLVAFIVPILNNVAYQFTQSRVSVAQIQRNGVTS